MRQTHSIQLQGSRNLKGQHIYLPYQLQSSEKDIIIKIQQNQKHIYCKQIFKSSIQQAQGEALILDCRKCAQINNVILELNHFQQNNVLVKKVKITEKLKRITIQVNELDWQIVHNKMALFQNIFLDQVSIVWHNAKLPLFYDENNQNYVTLYPLVNKPCLIDPYAAVQFAIRKQNNQIQFESEVYQEPFQIKLKLKYQRRNILKNGYDNVITVSQNLFHELKSCCKTAEECQQRQLFVVEGTNIFKKAPTFQQYNTYIKSQLAKNDTNLFSKSLVQILPQLQQNRHHQKENKQQLNPFQFNNSYLSQKQQQQSRNRHQDSQALLEQQFFATSRFCRQSCQISEEIKLLQKNKFIIRTTKTVQMLLKEQKRYAIQIEIVDQIDRTEQIVLEDIKKKFCHFFIQELIKKESFVFYQNYYPFFIDGKIYGLKLIQNANQKSKSTNKKSILGQQEPKVDQFIQIKNCGLQPNQSEHIFTQLIKIVQIKTSFTQKSQNNEIALIQNKTSQKWTKLFNFIEKQNNQRQTLQLFDKMFSQTHKESLNQIYNFVKKQRNQRNSFSSILITSYSSNGKTYLFQHLNKKGYKSHYLDMKLLMNVNYNFEDIRNYLTAFVSQSCYQLLFFDNIEYFLPHIDDSDITRKKQGVISEIFCQFLIKLVKKFNKKIIATSKSSQLIQKNILSNYNQVVKFKNPNRMMRNKLIQLIHQYQQSKNQLFLNNKQKLIDQTESYSLGSFAKYCIGMFLPTNVKTIAKKNDFSKIAGLNHAKNTIKSVIQKPNKYGFIYQKVKIKVPRGILLYGATGNGKSALGYSLQDQFSMKFFSIKGSDILSKYIGGSQAAVRQVFEKAMSVSPSIIFFDEFESIVPRRNSSGTGVTDRVVNQFLCYLDGVSQTTGVFIIAASSRPDLIDPALLRPGRIDSHVYIDYPNQQQRGNLLDMFKQSVDIEVDREKIIQLTQSYSYCDLIGMLKQLRIKQSASVLKQYRNSQQQLQASHFKKISKELFFKTLQTFRLATQKQQKKRQKLLYQNFKNGTSPDIKKQKFIQM